MNINYDVAVIGGGAGGITAALYLRRANINCCVIEKGAPGGVLNSISSIENYPGYKNITGPDLAYNFYEQLKDNDVKLINDEVIEIIDQNDHKTIKLKNNKELTAKKIILAIGRKPRNLENRNAEKFEGRGISFCALCDGFFFKNEDILVVGGGNSALEEALYLSDICKKVYMINRTEKLRGDKLLVERTLNKDNIEMIYSAQVKKFIGKNKLSSVDLDVNGETKKLKVKGCFIYIGYEPATDFLKSLDILDEKGYIIVNEFGKTRVDGIYACGDVIKKDVYQIITAAAEGAVAAISCIKEL